MNTAQDLYPSRQDSKETIIPRRDPVIWAQEHHQPPIDSAQLARYERDGFLILHDVFTPEEVACFRQELDRLRDDPMVAARAESITEADSGEVRSVFAVHRMSPVFARVAEDRRIADIAQYILADELYIHQSRINYKPGFRGQGFYWHSDFETWHVEDGMPRMRALSASVLLTENTDYNGPLMLMPGSHQDYITCVGETPEDHYKRSLKNQEFGIPSDRAMKHLFRMSDVVTSKAKTGSVILFDCNTIHGSNSNISPLPRSNAFFVYNAMSNRVTRPFCNRSPRPEYIAAREYIEPVKPGVWGLDDYRSARDRNIR